MKLRTKIRKRWDQPKIVPGNKHKKIPKLLAQCATINIRRKSGANYKLNRLNARNHRHLKHFKGKRVMAM